MSSIITKIAIWSGLTNSKDSPDELDELDETALPLSPSFPAGAAAGKKSKAPKYGQFQPVFDALQFALERFAVDEFQGHRAIDPHLICKVTLIEIQPLHENAEALLKEMLAIHKPERIAGFIQRGILATLTNGPFFDFSVFGGLAPLALQTQAAAEADELLADFGRDRATAGDYEISIHWDPAEAPSAETFPSPSPTPAPVEKSRPALPEDAWQLRDDRGPQSIGLTRRGSAVALLIGKDESADVTVNFKFVSSRHGVLWFDQGCWWYQDQNSTNGSRVCRLAQSDVVFPDRSGQDGTLPKAVAILPGAKIHFSSIVQENTPFLELPAKADGKTPTAPNPKHVGTPIMTPPPKSSRALARLRVEDAQGQRIHTVPADTLPFIIGRSSKAHIVIPAQHDNLSREHVQITAIEPGGARVQVLGDEGARLGALEIGEGQQLIWPWGKTLQLGQPDEQATFLNLTLLQAT